MKIIYKIFGVILLLSIFSSFVFSLYKGEIEKSNLTDWISAFCNLAMAGAALGGYLIAKDWKRHSVKDKVLALALDLKVNHANTVSDCLLDACNVIDSFETIYRAFIDKNEPTEALVKSLKDFREHLNLNSQKLKDAAFVFYQCHTQIQSLGYDYKRDLDVSIHNIEHDISEVYFNVKMFMSHFSYFLNFEHDDVSPDETKRLVFEDFKNENNLSVSLRISYKIDKLTSQLYLFSSKKGSVFNDLEYTG